MKTKPVSFSAPMIRAILAGRKTQTRRLVTGTALEWLEPPVGFSPEFTANPENHLFPHYAGDRLWVQEGYALERSVQNVAEFGSVSQIAARGGSLTCPCRYLADGERRTVALTPEDVQKLAKRKTPPTKQQPGRFMYQSCSRITLAVSSLRVERLQDISEADALAEGVTVDVDRDGWRYLPGGGYWVNSHPPEWGVSIPNGPVAAFTQLWEALHGLGSWDLNPWVRVTGFEVEVR